MTELLFTEDQWRAVLKVESLSKQHWFFDECFEKRRVCGPSFSDGEYFIAKAPENPPDHDFVGPYPPFYYCLFEGGSRLQICGGWTLEYVLRNARERLTLIPGEYLDVMKQRLASDAAEWNELYGEERAANAERQAASEARQAIAKARAQKKAAPKKIGRRRRAIFEESGGKCHYCQAVLTLDGRWHVEHKMPKALGGTNEPGNLVASCAPCNHAKRDKTDLEFIALRASQTATAGA